MRIETSLGNCALAISGIAKDGQGAALENIAGASLVYRAGGSKLFGKKSGHSRDEAFSEKLATDAAATIEAVLAPYFDNVEVSAKAYVPKADSVAKALDVLRNAGVDVSKLEMPKTENEGSVG